MPSIGLRLKKLRKELGKTQEEVANDLGLQRITYAQYEIDRREADYETLQKIADYYKTTTDFLLGRNDVIRESQSNYGTQVKFSEEEMDFVRNLDLMDEELIKKYNFNVDGEKLSKEEIKEMLAYIRARRHMVEMEKKSEK